MIEVLSAIEAWLARGERVAVATVVGVENSAPRDPGAVLALSESGEVAGSVSGGCVEAAVCEEAQAALASGRARLVTYGISDADAIAVGLTCGGTIAVFIEPLDPAPFERLAAAVRSARPVVLVTRLDGERSGAKLLVFVEEEFGELGTAELDRAAAREARALPAAGGTATHAFGKDGEPAGTDVHVFIQAFVPEPDMYIFGAIDLARALARLGKYLGYTVTVVDARPVFATAARVPDADRVVVAWPDEFLRSAPVDARTALIVLTHDIKFDIPLLQAALRTPAGYIGAMGSRATHAKRLRELQERGISAQDVARIQAPIGLDIGARTPAETALSIAAEIVAVRENRRGGRLRESTGPVHNLRAAAAATAR